MLRKLFDNVILSSIEDRIGNYFNIIFDMSLSLYLPLAKCKAQF